MTTREQRMRSYEAAWTVQIPPKTYTVLRLDGRSFTRLTQHCTKPFDLPFMACMDGTMRALCEEIQEVRYAYTQSDEISILITDFGPKEQRWFGGETAKTLSIAAGTASAVFSSYFENTAVFDCRILTLPNREEVINYFLWRQADCFTNAVSMAAYAHFSHRQLMHVSTAGRMQMLESAGLDISGYSIGARQGRICTSETYTGPITYTRRDTGQEITEEVQRSRWVSAHAPWFDWDQSGFLYAHTPQEPA